MVRPRFIRLLSALLVVACLGACTTSPTPYQAETDRYGYSDQRLEDDRYRVSFAGNSATPRETVQNYLLFRAAELTLESGHDYFTIVDQELEGTSSGGASPRVGVGMGSGGSTSIGIGMSTFLGGGSGGGISYTGYADIVVRDGEKPAGDPESYDARDLIGQLRPTVARSGG